MASETIFAYVGQKGSGKTHEGVIRIVEAVNRGRSVVAVMPDLNLQRLADLCGKELDDLKRWVRVADYDDMYKSDFWPGHSDESSLRAGSRSFRSDAWKSGFVRSGDLLVLDEMWRLMEPTTGMDPKEKLAHKRLKVAMHMARHWRGPLDWSDPENVKKYLDSDWDPSKGGPDGDGTPLVSMNILILTQKYHDLDKKMIGQVDQVTDLYSFPADKFPKWMQKLPFLGKTFDTRGKYNAVTFDGDKLPARDSHAYKDAKSFRVHYHRPEIHYLIEKEGGQALEVPIDDRRKLSDSKEAKHLKFWLIMLIPFLIFSYFSLKRAYDKYLKPKPDIEVVEQDKAAIDAITGVPSSSNVVNSLPNSSPVIRYDSIEFQRSYGNIGGTSFIKTDKGIHVTKDFLKTSKGVEFYDKKNDNVITRYSVPVSDGIRSNGERPPLYPPSNF